MKKIEWFYFIATVLGFFVDLSAVIAFFVEFRSSDFGIKPAAGSWFAILSILALFYAMFAFASWRYWIWLSVYSLRLAHFGEAFDERARNRRAWEKQERARQAEKRKKTEQQTGKKIIAWKRPIYEVRMPVLPRGYGKSGIYLAIGLGILAYPPVAIWGLTFISDIIWSTSGLEFTVLLLAPFALSGLAVLTAVITVSGFQYFVG